MSTTARAPAVALAEVDLLYAAAHKKVQRFLAIYQGEALNDEGVHALRVLTKQLRAYLKLYPGAVFYGRKHSHNSVRQLANAFAEARDAKVKRDTLQALTEEQPQLAENCQALIRYWAHPARGSIRSLAARTAYASLLKDILHQWPCFPLSRKELAAELKNSYRKARKRGNKALRSNGNDARMHLWRKAGKTLFYNLAAFFARDVQRPVKNKSKLKKLNARLGQYHDLAMLRAALQAQVSAARLDDASLTVLLQMIEAKKNKEKKKIRQQFHKVYRA